MKKVLQIIRTIFTWAIAALAILMMVFTVLYVTMVDKADRNILGFKAFIVLSDSMEATDFAAGDIVFSKEVDPSTLEVGDIITFQSLNSENYGQIVTHKIHSLTTDAEGRPGFKTYGTTTGAIDESVVTYDFVLGQYMGRVPKAGYFFQFLKTTPGYIICILIPFLLLILSQGINCIRLFRKYRSEQMAEMQQERDQIAAERAESQKMMEELMALKAQLAQSQPQPNTAQTPQAQPQEQPQGEPTVTEDVPVSQPENAADDASGSDQTDIS